MDVEALYRGEVGDGLNEVVWRVASRAKVHLDEARALADGVPAWRPSSSWFQKQPLRGASLFFLAFVFWRFFFWVQPRCQLN